jgi:hypothetical protein
MIDERFNFTGTLKKNILYAGIAGVVLLVLGVILENLGGAHGSEEAVSAASEGHHYTWLTRLWAGMWINNVYFTGLAIIGVFFVAVNYAAQAGWSAVLKRIPEAFGAWLPFAGVLMLVVFLLGSHDLFHWTHEEVYLHDPIIAGKRPFLNIPFFLIRMVIYFGLWILMFTLIRKKSLQEDEFGGLGYWKTMRKYSTIFIIIFAVTSSIAAWDWILSIDPHWFSTLIGWYVFASWFAAGLAAITLLIVLLKDNGYLSFVSQEHLHDLGKFVFAFSIFWSYLWLSQFLLIYYSNIPEEIVYYVERMKSAQYAPYFYLNIILNFFFPFLVLMTRDSKRHGILIKIACVVVMAGHWLDFFLMIVPGTLKSHGTLGFMEIGLTLIYGAAFVFVVLGALAKAPLLAKNHPMLQESLHHHT